MAGTGRVIAVCKSERRPEPKTNVGEGLLRAGWGLVGDSHSGPRQPNRWQISLLAWESVARLEQEYGLDARPGSFAENLTCRGLDLSQLEVGNHLQVGEQVVLEVEQLGKPSSIAHTYSFEGHSLLATEGVFCGVLEGGRVVLGDEICILARGQN
jgi:MOSC domain-containing protein YiiM